MTDAAARERALAEEALRANDAAYLYEALAACETARQAAEQHARNVEGALWQAGLLLDEAADILYDEGYIDLQQRIGRFRDEQDALSARPTEETAG